MNKRLIGKNTWNYRVFKEDDPDGFLFVRRVFYDKNGKIIDYDREDAAICGIDRKDMLAIGKLILEDIGRSGKPLYEKILFTVGSISFLKGE